MRTQLPSCHLGRSGCLPLTVVKLGTEGRPLCQSPSHSTIYTCCLRRDQQLSQLPALLLLWNPPLRWWCAQQRPAQAGEHSRLCLRHVMDTLLGHRALCLMRRVCQCTGGVPANPGPPLRSSASAPPRLPRRSTAGHLFLPVTLAQHHLHMLFAA